MPLTITQCSATDDETPVCVRSAAVATDGSGVVVVELRVCNDGHRPLNVVMSAGSADYLIRAITELRGRLAAAGDN